MDERRVPAGERMCTCGHTLMQHVLMGPCHKYPCACMEFKWIAENAASPGQDGDDAAGDGGG